MGGIPTNYWGEVIRGDAGDPERIVPGLMAVGEAACVSVHGANRLGSNSLIDLVVFGRAAAQRAAETVDKSKAMPDLPDSAAEAALARFDHFRHAKGGTRTAELRLKMQKTMQTNCAVFRDGPVLAEGDQRIREVWKGGADIAVSDRVADLELRPDRDARVRQSDRSGGGHGRRRAPSQGEPRRARARGLSRSRRQELDDAHPRVGGSENMFRTLGQPPGRHPYAHQRSELHRAKGQSVLKALERGWSGRCFRVNVRGYSDLSQSKKYGAPDRDAPSRGGSVHRRPPIGICRPQP